MLKIDGITPNFKIYEINSASKNNVNVWSSKIKGVTISPDIPLSSIPPTGQIINNSIPKIAHFHLYLSPAITTVEDEKNFHCPVQNTFSFENTPTDRKYSINIPNAFRNIIDFIEKNLNYQICLWTDHSSEKAIKKIALNNELSPELFNKIMLCDIHKFFDGWNYDPQQKKLLSTFFRQEMIGAGKNLAAAKDIAQYAVLEAFGGLGIDCDVAARQALGQLETPSGIRIFLTVQKDRGPMISNAVIAAAPHHRTLQKTIEHINHTYQGNWHELPEMKYLPWKSCSIYHAYQPEMQEITQKESIALLRKEINEDKRFFSTFKTIGFNHYKSIRVGLTVAATGPGALRCGMDRTVGSKHDFKDFSFEKNNEIFGHITDSVKYKDRFTTSRENIIQDGLQDDGKSWSASTRIKRRDSF